MTPRAGGPDAIRTMVVDDSVTVRKMLTSTLDRDPAIRVVASCADGAIALDQIARAAPDVVLLDVEMPGLDGLATLPRLLGARPGMAVIMVSSHTVRNAEVTLKALELGAADYLPKPTAQMGPDLAGFKSELIDKVRLFGGKIVRRRLRGAAAAQAEAKPIKLRPPLPGALPPRILAVGSSTGGPEALFSFFGGLPRLAVPVVLTQHMPPSFTPILAQHIEKRTGWPCAEAGDGAILQPGHIHLAPGNRHLTVERAESGTMVRLTDDPPENFCRPAVDPMLRSLARAYGGRVVAVILTGMGADGLKGGGEIVAAGGSILAQDEATSVVWGMPGAVATAGLCSAVLPLAELAPHVGRLFRGGVRP